MAPGALPGPAQTEQADDDQSKKPENHIGLWVTQKQGRNPNPEGILIMAAAVAALAVLLIFRKKKKK